MALDMEPRSLAGGRSNFEGWMQIDPPPLLLVAALLGASCDVSAPPLHATGAHADGSAAALDAGTDGGPSRAEDAATPSDGGGEEDGGEPRRPGPERGIWLKGDLHVHSAHSSDAQDSPVADVIAKAEQLGLDYLAITDHDNHVEGQLTTWNDVAHHSDELMLLYGVEWTTGLGHANLFSSAPFDHAALYALRDGPGRTSIEAAHAQGIHFSVNHPAAKDLWEHGFELSYDSMEVWTAVFLVPNSNDRAIELWDDVLRGGRRMTARGGSDSHHQHDAESLLFDIGNPTTWVRAREVSTAAVLEALKAGRVSVSYAPAAERVELRADADGDGTFEALMGDSIPADGADLALQVEVVGFRSGAGYELTLVKNGETFTSAPLHSAITTFRDTVAPGERAYYRAELRGDTPLAPLISSLGFGRFIALTNPIYVGFL
jgi:hypothetical protein